MKKIAKHHCPVPRLGVLAATAALALAGHTAALAEGPWSFSANIGAVSNYVWRGVTQSDDKAAIQGGLDVAHESGFYAGTWASNIDWGPDYSANYELDFYAGYDFSLPDENASLGLNTIYYAYPGNEVAGSHDDNVDFWEIGISGGYDFGAAALSGGIQYTVWGGDANQDALFSDGDLYYSAALDFPLPQDFGFGVFLGYYDFQHDREMYTDSSGFDKKASLDYWHWGATVSKDAGDFGTFSFTYEQVDGDSTDTGDLWDQDPKVWVGWSKEF